jgi:hypothetical protein
VSRPATATPTQSRARAETRTAEAFEPTPRTNSLRGERLWQAVVTVASGALFMSTFSSQVALGDGPESVAGVRTLGVLHAPGYPTYVLAAHAFGELAALGSWSLRVNLFSVICASVAVGLAFRIARQFGANRFGAAIGAGSLAVTASFWFNADFAKYYAFATVLIAGAMFAALTWEERGSSLALMLSGLCLGASFGAGWQLCAIVTVGVAVLVWVGPREPTVHAIIAGVGAAALTAVGSLVFILVRASQDPTLNWGNANTTSRLLRLIGRTDFAGIPGTGTGTSQVASRFAVLVGGAVRDFGVAAVCVAVVGVVTLWRRRVDIGYRSMLLIIGGLNLVAVAIGSPISGMYGFQLVVPAGGYLLGTMLVLAVLIGVGAGAILEFAEGEVRKRRTENRSVAVLVATGAVIVLVAVLLLPSVLVHRTYADQRIPPLADRYGLRVLDALPPHAVLLVWGQEYSMPMVYRQLVDHDRADVTVVSANSVGLDWAREQLTRRLHLGTSLTVDREDRMLQRMIATLRTTRPVYLDVTAMHVLAPYVAYRNRGFVGEVIDGTPGPHEVPDIDKVASAVDHADATDGLDDGAYRRLVFLTTYGFHERAHLEVAKAYALAGDLGKAEREIQKALAVNPADTAARGFLAGLSNVSPSDAKKEILAL